MIISEKLMNKRLRDLLRSSFGSNENPWISKLEAERAVFRVAEGHGVSLEGARDIFSRRGRRNQKLGSPIAGFEYLLKNLETTQAQTVLIHEMIDGSRTEYRIFTDPDINELIGLLKFPKERLAKHFVP